MLERVDKLIVSQGQYSRSEVKALVSRRRVLVDGVAIRSSSEKVNPDTARIVVNGAELVFKKEDSYLVSEEYIQSHKAKGRLLWCNPLVYYYKSQLTGGHNDDVAVSGDPEYGWGWLMDKGFDILQTDWILALRNFVDNRKA